ncbi:MAG: hypothetical protein HY921_07695 [Elusimicrobia bacterium]|nr:hypothetical protein [Elusimicrobiota bacterium]
MARLLYRVQRPGFMICVIDNPGRDGYAGAVMLVPFLCLAGLIWLGLAISYEDWLRKKIRNQALAYGFWGCLFGLSYLIVNTYFGYRGWRWRELGEFYLPWPYYSKMAGHMALSLASAYALWSLNIWPAGDAKLFTLYAFFLPLIDPNLPGFPRLLFLVMLINIFVPAGAFFVLETAARGAAVLPRLGQSPWRRQAHAWFDCAWVRLRDALPFWSRYLALGVNLLALFLGLRLLEARCHSMALGPLGHIAVYLAMAMLWGRLSALLSGPRAGAAALAAVSAWCCWLWLGRGWDAWAAVSSAAAMVFNFGLFLTAARMFFTRVLERLSLRRLDPAQLAPGAVLSRQTWEDLGKERELSQALERRYSDGLSHDEALVLRKWLDARGDGARAGGYSVYETIPFAVWIFMGAILCLGLPGTVVSWSISHARGWTP